MSTDLIDLTAYIVIAHASVTEMSSNDLLKEIKTVYAALEALTKGGKALTTETSDKPQKASAKKIRGSAEPLTENAEEKTAMPPAPASKKWGRPQPPPEDEDRIRKDER